VRSKKIETLGSRVSVGGDVYYGNIATLD
jgi:hypothetical protein